MQGSGGREKKEKREGGVKRDIEIWSESRKRREKGEKREDEVCKSSVSC